MTSLQNLLRQPNPPAVMVASVQNDADRSNSEQGRRSLPLERIKRNYNDASFRQAASEMGGDGSAGAGSLSLPPDRQAATLSKNGNHSILGAGLMLEAEREFHAGLWPGQPNECRSPRRTCRSSPNAVATMHKPAPRRRPP